MSKKNTYYDYQCCVLCGCKETIEDETGEFCIQCGMPEESFIEDRPLWEVQIHQYKNSDDSTVLRIMRAMSGR